MIFKRGRHYWCDFQTMDKPPLRIRRSLRCTDASAAAVLERELQQREAKRVAGLVSPFDAHEKRPLTEHLEDWRRWLTAKGNTDRHARDHWGKAKRLIDGCRFSTWKDIGALRVQEWLHEQRKEGLSPQTANYYLAAVKGFCRWMVKDRRAAESTIAHLSAFNTQGDRRHDRRAFDDAELRVLLDATATLPTRCGMTGPQRAMLYRFAVETGLRAGEIRSLTPASCDLDADEPTVTVAAAYSKHRREDVQPIRRDFAFELASYLDGRAPDVPIFDLPHPCTIVRMLRADMRVARARWILSVQDRSERRKRRGSTFLAYRDDSGRCLDFHAFRHTFITRLTRADVAPKLAQSLARHSRIDLTMNLYTHVARVPLSEAIERTPTLDAPRRRSDSERAVALATGTDGNATVPYTCHKSVPIRHVLGNSGTVGDKGVSPRNIAKNPGNTRVFAMGRGGVEPPTHGFSVRCSTN